MKRLAVILVMLLPACASTGDRRAAQMERRDGETCRSLDFVKGTPDYSKCLQQEAATRAARRGVIRTWLEGK